MQLDRMLTVARDAGVTNKVEITAPADVQTAYQVTETREVWQLGSAVRAAQPTRADRTRAS
ncbi:MULTISPECIES: hypothetical protein [Gordonia]|uniref:Uncharacterized protein n=1 Tax=Gordonia tangerina TaxID=2911060 RepID=A0ABS9DI78_9ACTN|nr:hypothetical protein [Gordonia tangerina]MCF3938933.1 hypothetical protein [Gordonia tangerina]